MSLLIVFSLPACSDGKTGKYCYNCGESFAEKVSFCSQCGAPMVKSADELPVAKTTSESTVSATELSTEPSHQHSFNGVLTHPTCTEKGFTTYYCLCGESYIGDYVDPAHSFEDYVCTYCKAVDKAHAKEYMIEWVKENGKQMNNMISWQTLKDEGENRYMVGVGYNENRNCLCLIYIKIHSNGKKVFEYTVYLSPASTTYDYVVTDSDYSMYGVIDAANYKRGSSVTCDDFKGDESQKEQAIRTTSLATNALLDFMHELIETYELGIEVKDLGFAVYQI